MLQRTWFDPLSIAGKKWAEKALRIPIFLITRQEEKLLLAWGLMVGKQWNQPDAHLLPPTPGVLPLFSPLYFIGKDVNLICHGQNDAEGGFAYEHCNRTFMVACASDQGCMENDSSPKYHWGINTWPFLMQWWEHSCFDFPCPCIRLAVPTEQNLRAG